MSFRAEAEGRRQGSVSFRAEAEGRSRGIVAIRREAPLSGRSRFLDSLRSLGMTSRSPRRAVESGDVTLQREPRFTILVHHVPALVAAERDARGIARCELAISSTRSAGSCSGNRNTPVATNARSAGFEVHRALEAMAGCPQAARPCCAPPAARSGRPDRTSSAHPTLSRDSATTNTRPRVPDRRGPS